VKPTRTTLQRRVRRGRIVRRGFNLIEMLIALAITAALLAATMVALDASFMAYQATTEVASTHTIGRLAMLRMLTLIRTGQRFGPFPINPQDSILESNSIEFETPNGMVIELRFDEGDEALYIVRDPGGAAIENLLLEGVIPQYDGPDLIPPFTLEYELGRKLHRATIDLTIEPDDNMSVELDGQNLEQIRLVASAMPRVTAYQD
jgi:prepilin-type N-terminal cleavage/methylation domain-containing protein